MGYTKNQRRAARAFALMFIESAEYRASVERRIKHDTLAPQIESMLWAYAHGRPPDKVDVTVNDITKVSGVDLSDLTEDQLASRAATIAANLAAFAAAERQRQQDEEMRASEEQALRDAGLAEKPDDGIPMAKNKVH